MLVWARLLAIPGLASLLSARFVVCPVLAYRTHVVLAQLGRQSAQVALLLSVAHLYVVCIVLIHGFPASWSCGSEI
jgi:hypothetical protein